MIVELHLMNWYKTSVKTKTSFKTDDIPHLSKGQLLNLVSLEILDEDPDREKLWAAINSLIAMQERWPFHIGSSVMDKVDGFIYNKEYRELRDRQWPTDEDKGEARQAARDLLLEIMNEFM